MTISNRFRLSILYAAVAGSTSALAQTPPDAGRTLQQQTPPLEAPKASRGITMDVPASVPTQPGGMQVTLRSINIEGNSLFSQAELLAVLGDIPGKSFDLAGLRKLAESISDYYHQKGYPFARAYLPPQSLESGTLRIAVIEGRYGKVEARGDSDLAAQAQHFLAPLKPGTVIESADLERATLLLSDLPGLRATPIIRPGQELGTGDLDVQVERGSRYSGEAGLDNQGNRYTGQVRAHFNLDINSPLLLGDQLTLRTLYTEQGMWFGNAGYSLPLGSSGLRAEVGYSHTYYELGKEFSSLDATGTANVISAGLSYPIIRSQRLNLNFSGIYQHKRLNDKAGATNTSTDKSSDTLPLTLAFDMRDSFGGGGINYGALAWTAGHLTLDGTLSGSDSATAQSAGTFQKWNLSAARIQAVTGKLSLYGRVSAQWANKNLDSSEKFGLGGPSGVRAYPVGEAYGDEGWLTQLEARYAVGPCTLYGFYDAGGVRINVNPWAAGSNNRSIAGAGAGVRYQHGAWNLDASLAWRTHGGAPQSDTSNRNPMGWLGASYKF